MAMRSALKGAFPPVLASGVTVILGLLYGVLLPTLPPLPKALAWGGLLMPMLWSGVSYGLMGVVNPALRKDKLQLLYREGYYARAGAAAPAPVTKGDSGRKN